MGKIALKSNKGGGFQIEPERRWTVIMSETGQRAFLRSENGIDHEEAERISATLVASTEVVPEAALDKNGKLVPELLEDAIAAASAPAE